MTTPGVCARRGLQWLTKDDLRAHLAALLRLENVGVLLGSGASVGPLGGKTIAQLWSDFESKFSNSKKWLEDNGFLSATRFNIEILADDLEIAGREWRRAGNTALPELDKARADLQRAVIESALLQQRWWAEPGVPVEAPELASHRSLLQKLTSARQPGQPAPWVFTTNYDLAVEWSAETIGLKTINGFDGLHRREFSPHNFDLGWRNVLARGEARFGTYHVYLAKLHGSLSWYRNGDVVQEAAAEARWGAFEKFLTGAHDDVPGVIVLPSTAKYDQTVGFVLGDMFRRFAEFLARPQTSVFVSGYSFADDHLNRLLRSALQNPTLQLVVFLPEVSRGTDDDLDLDAASAWVRRLASLQSPQVTIVGEGRAAWFSEFVNLLPDPAIFDEHSVRIRKMLKDFDDARGSAP